MKILLALLLSGSLAATAGAQTSATSVPVGFMSLTIPGTGGTVPARFSMLSVPLMTNALWQSLSTTAVTAGSSALTDSNATWADDQFNGAAGLHYLEVVSIGGSPTATGVGTIYTIADTDAGTKTLTVAGSFADGVAGTVGYRVRKFWTLASLFGAANTAGFTGGTLLTADQVLLWNGAGYDTYYYQTSGIGGTGWRKAGDQTADASAAVISPVMPMMVRRVQTDDLRLTGMTSIIGTVKVGATAAAIAPGLNYVANPYAVDMTLASSGLYTGSSSTGLAAGSDTTADQVLVWNTGTNSFDTYYYLTGAGWRNTTSTTTDAGGTVLAKGAGFIVRRGNAGAFTWSMPQHPASL